jgi:23S rRNA (guanosine2251-2'-O)-methyltransferase
MSVPAAEPPRESVLIYGLNPVLEALRAGRVCAVRLADVGSSKTAEVRRLAAACGAQVTQVPVVALDRVTNGAVHQGVVADVTGPVSLTLDQLVDAAGDPALLLVLDGIEDPQNLGAIIRVADAAAVDGVVRQTRRAAPLDRVAKTSAGAVAHVRFASVVNIARAISRLQARHIWTIGLAADGEDLYEDVDLTVPTALVLGSEGQGLRRLVRERCDRVVSIPMSGRVNSLNVATAASVALFEAVRQRRRAQV